MAVKNFKSDMPVIIIPGSPQVYSKIIITGDDSTDYTVHNSYSGSTSENFLVGNATINRTATDKLGTFKLRIVNDNGRFLDYFNGGELVRFYSDTTDGTTFIFAGKIDNVLYGYDFGNGFYIDLNGRGYPELTDMTITGQEAAATADVSIGGILYEFYSDVALLFWNGSSWSEATYDSDADTVDWSPAAPSFPSTLINMSYQNKKGLSVISEICKKAGLDSYIEYDDAGSRWTLRVLIEGSIENEACGVTYGGNLATCNNLGIDNTKVFNRAIVYGKQESSNIVIIKTENDTESQSNLWVKDKVFNAPTLTTMDEVQDKADSELVGGIITSIGGRVSALGLPSLRPGDNIAINIPYCNINGYYKAKQFTHNIGGRGFITTIDMTQKQNKIEDLFVEKANPDEINIANTNINNMKDSYTVFFDESPSILVHDGTLESSGQLRLGSNETSGKAYAVPITADYTVTQCELRRYENFQTEDDVYEVTADGGVNWEIYSTASGNVHIFANTGTRPTFRLTLNRNSTSAPSPAYESVALLIK